MKKMLKADILTPMMAYMRLEGDHKVILESIPRDQENARFSIIAYQPVHEIKFEEGVLTCNGEVLDRDPLDFLNELVVRNCDSNLPFAGGAIGFVGYDMIALYEPIGDLPQDTIGLPDMHFFLYESYLVFDHKEDLVHLVEDNIYSGRDRLSMEHALEASLERLQTPNPQEFEDVVRLPLDFQSHLSQDQFEDMVRTAQALIDQGDMFQCVLSQRFSASFTGDPLAYYRHLRVTNPSNYLYLLDFGAYQVIGASPESLVSVKKGRVTTNPIAGTRPRGQNELEDQAYADDLLQDSKERAEHQMLVDLGRNDLGRISEIGSVRVNKYMEVERFRHVMHLSSLVRGDLKTGLRAVDALKATLPAGTVSGAPKIRAMQRIYELEQEKRGLYAGTLGYLSATGDMDVAIAIRTMVIKNGRAYVQAGAGIVADSIPSLEYQETLNKAKAMTKMGDS